MSGKKIEVKCDNCGIKFMARIADRKRGWAKNCSKSCAASSINKRTGNYKRYMRSQDKVVNEFSNAHLFSNEEH